MENKVSIISSVYNGSKYLDVFLKSIINQTYDNIQLVIVDDGSTDNSIEILNSWKTKFYNRNFEYKIIKQNNAGASAALSTAMNYVDGIFLMWMDSDDELIETAISNRVNLLGNHRNAFIISSVLIKNDEGDIISSYKRNNRKKMFKDLIIENNVFFSGGAYLIWMDQAREIFNEKMYLSQAGQNWQILLPLTYKYKPIFDFSNSFIYYIHKESHSRKKISDNEWILRFEEHEKIVQKTLLTLDLSKKELDLCFKLAEVTKKEKICRFYINKKKYSQFKKYFNEFSIPDLRFLRKKILVKFILNYFGLYGD